MDIILHNFLFKRYTLNSQFLDLTSLEDASSQLKTAIDFSISDLAKTDVKIFEQFRNSVVQCFEYTYQLSVKSLRRYIELTSDNPSLVDDWEFKDLIREAAVRGIIEKPQDWFDYRKLRNISSHAYSRSKAEEVYQKAENLYYSSQSLISFLKSKRGSS